MILPTLFYVQIKFISRAAEPWKMSFDKSVVDKVEGRRSTSYSHFKDAAAATKHGDTALKIIGNERVSLTDEDV